MAQTAERPPTPQGEGGQRNPPSAQAQNPVAVAAAIADLTIECAVEAAHVASVAARYFVEQMELGDLWAAEHSLGVAARHLREAIVQFSEWRTLEVRPLAGVMTRLVDQLLIRAELGQARGRENFANEGKRGHRRAAQAAFLRIAEDYTWVNPHLTLTVKWDRDGCDPVQWAIPATDSAWRKWRPSDPTSPHWYDEARLARLIANNIAYAQDHGILCRTVADFVREFRGLSGTAKARDICEAVGASRTSLADFYCDGEGARVGALLGEMCQRSRAIKPRDLGIIGEAHLRAKFERAGAAPESFNYKRSEIECGGVPYLAEAAFGYCPEGADERRIITGVNWAVAIGGDPFRRLGDLGQSLGAILTKQRAGPSEPIITVLHLACPRIEYLDRGKSSVNLP